MSIQADIKFWKKAHKMILQDYGKPCKDFVFSCGGCQAHLTAAWIRNHIDLLKWELKDKIK